MVKLKICGMKYPKNIQSVAKLQADYLGFIFYDKSPRFFNGEIPEISKRIKKTGVFVDAPVENVLEKVKEYNLQAVQLHGQESPDYCNELSNNLSFLHPPCQEQDEAGRQESVEIIKAFSIKNRFDFEVLKPYEEVCDYYLFDTKGKLPGGNGYTFNWSVLKNYPSKKPFFLSGGIGSEEVENILSFLQKKESHYCYAIDVNSKFEVEPGLKDIEKLNEFISNLLY